MEANSGKSPTIFAIDGPGKWLRRLKKRLKNVLEDKLGGGSTLSENQVKTLFRRVFDAESAHLAGRMDVPNFENDQYIGNIVAPVARALNNSSEVSGRGTKRAEDADSSD